ncbi:MAG TPA: hypothetical protein VEI52_07860 [Terriglobales bacterium]|nr:hypothetical protein [Terriglobales bacterium]
MKKILPFYLALVALTLDAVLVQCQQLTIQPEVGKQTVFTKADIESLAHVKVTTHTSETSAAVEGVALKPLLEKAGVEFGHSLKGKRLASCLLVEAADGYRVVIALPEIDPDFSDKTDHPRLPARRETTRCQCRSLPNRNS